MTKPVYYVCFIPQRCPGERAVAGAAAAAGGAAGAVGAGPHPRLAQGASPGLDHRGRLRPQPPLVPPGRRSPHRTGRVLHSLRCCWFVLWLSLVSRGN